MNSIHQDINQTVADDPAIDDHTIATQILTRAGLDNKQIDYLLEVVVKYVADARRNHWRAAEREAFADFVRTKQPATTGQIELLKQSRDDDPFRSLIAAGASFRPGRNRGEVTWEDATISDHEERIAFLTVIRKGIDTTINRHQAAIAAIRAAGVTCLGEIDAQQDAA